MQSGASGRSSPLDIKMDPARWEMGSEFHWPAPAPGPFFPWPEPAVWFMLARHAVAALVEMHAASRPTLWLPSYFCPEVAESCAPYCQVREYRDMPQWSEPDWTSLQPTAHDIVLALNYFGIREGQPWKRWREKVACVLLEDHSQDPFSDWSLNSTADYAFASLRKTLPIADGAILWSPKGLALPPTPEGCDWSGVEMKARAMIYKSEYLAGSGSEALKSKYRDLQLRGEAVMRKSKISAISKGSAAYLANGSPRAWREQRSRNAHHIMTALSDVDDADFLFPDPPANAAPFTVPLVFSSERERDAVQSRFQKNRIYCPVHWVCQTADRDALNLSRRILSLPVDQRYTCSDMDRIAQVFCGEMSEVPGRNSE